MKTYKEMAQQQELNELSILRTGSALVFATKVRTSGDKVEQHIRSALGDFNKAKSQDKIDKKIDAMVDGLTELAQAVVQQRMMLGNMTGISVSQSILNQRTNKQMIKLLKRR